MKASAQNIGPYFSLFRPSFSLLGYQWLSTFNFFWLFFFSLPHDAKELVNKGYLVLFSVLSVSQLNVQSKSALLTVSLDSNSRDLPVVARMRLVIKERGGFFGLYRGIVPGSIRSFMSNGTSMIAMSWAQRKVSQWGLRGWQCLEWSRNIIYILKKTANILVFTDGRWKGLFLKYSDLVFRQWRINI